MKSPIKPVFPVSQASYRRALVRIVREALAEDLGSGDITNAALNLRGKRGRAILLAKENGVLAGADVFTECFRRLDRRVVLKWKSHDGDRIRAGNTVATISGDASAILSAERSALNFVSHLSGIATVTASMVALISRTPVRLLDTRKTTPGLRLLEKRATVLGGALNHRLGLYDALMVKDNHIAAMGSIEASLPLAAKKKGRRQLICEIAEPHQVRIALDLGATWLLLDNFSRRDMRMSVQRIRQWEREHNRKIVLEASGGITPRNITAVARTGVDYISSGHITHSATAIDFSLEWDGPPAAKPSRRSI